MWLVKKVMGTMRKKLDLSLIKDGAHVEGIGRHKAFKKQVFFCFFLYLVCVGKTLKKIENNLLIISVFLFLTHAKQKFYGIFLKNTDGATLIYFN